MSAQDWLSLAIQAFAALATAVAAVAAWKAAKAARDSARQGAQDLSAERRIRRIEGLQRVHEHLLGMQAVGDSGRAEWQAAFGRFRAAILATTEPLVKCAEFNNVIVRGERGQRTALLTAAIAEVQHAISRVKQDRPVRDEDGTTTKPPPSR
jgi:hypothetical protein